MREVQGHAFIQNLRHGHYELGVETVPVYRLATAFDAPLARPKMRPLYRCRHLARSVPTVDIVVQYFDGCPNWELADERVRAALSQLGLTATDVAHELVDTPEKAAAAGFRGSPTILVNGRDPFIVSASPVGLYCRLFTTPDGLVGSPTIDQLVHAIESAA